MEKYTSMYYQSKTKINYMCPQGLPTGFAAYASENIVLYKCTREYNKNGESGTNPTDESLNIDWGIDKDNIIISEKNL